MKITVEYGDDDMYDYKLHQSAGDMIDALLGIQQICRGFLKHDSGTAQQIIESIYGIVCETIDDTQIS